MPADALEPDGIPGAMSSDRDGGNSRVATVVANAAVYGDDFQWRGRRHSNRSDARFYHPPARGRGWAIIHAKEASTGCPPLPLSPHLPFDTNARSASPGDPIIRSSDPRNHVSRNISWVQ